ncbi:MAG: hypothetical protein K6A65_05670, partial [Succinivibrionaceae bacterium]|nr:hypothetical protein [Succinivibrionaceae bacterium]
MASPFPQLLSRVAALSGLSSRDFAAQVLHCGVTRACALKNGSAAPTEEDWRNLGAWLDALAGDPADPLSAALYTPARIARALGAQAGGTGGDRAWAVILELGRQNPAALRRALAQVESESAPAPTPEQVAAIDEELRAVGLGPADVRAV